MPMIQGISSVFLNGIPIGVLFHKWDENMSSIPLVEGDRKVCGVGGRAATSSLKVADRSEIPARADVY